MEAFLIDLWLRDTGESLSILDEASVSLAREAVRREGERLGLPVPVVASLATAASELGHNQLKPGHAGLIALRAIARDGVPGLEIVAADQGDGIENPTEALRGAGSASGGLGVGLSGVRNLVDEVDFDIRLGEGTCIWARKFATPVPRRQELGILGRPHPAERVSGDAAGFVRLEGSLTLAVADGLGHGPAAREASLMAIRHVLEHPERHLPDLQQECHAALSHTRGAVMALARIADDAATIASVGNVAAYVCGPGMSHRFVGSQFALGVPGPARNVRLDRAPIWPRDALLLYTDGLSARASLEGELDLLREHPIVVAHAMLERFGRDDDDALVLVAR